MLYSCEKLATQPPRLAYLSLDRVYNLCIWEILMSSSTVMKQGIREKCIDWVKSVVDSAISTPPLLSGEHISEHTYMSGPLYG